MRLKQISILLFAIFTLVTLGSCNDDSTTKTVGASADAQIYSFNVAAIPVTSVDSVNFPIMAKRRFSIDQFRGLIYNPDSLPYKTVLKKFAATLSYSSAGVSKVQLVYSDSTSNWNGKDSIDFSLKPKIRITAANGMETREYTIDIRIHKIDPDTLPWQNLGNHPSTVGIQKTLLKDNTFYTFSVDTDGSLSLYKAPKASSLTWAKQAITTGPSATNILLESITLFNNTFYVIDKNDLSYSSTDGINWTAKNSNVKAIFGVLPGADATKDSLLVATVQGGKNVFAKTFDMSTLKTVGKVSNNLFSNEIVGNFPISEFSSVTFFDRTNLNRNILTITGGKTLDGVQSNLTWSLLNGDGRLDLGSNQENSIFAANAGISCFLYDDYLFALTKNVLYKTTRSGSKWIEAPSKESFDIKIVKASGQSIIVDSENYIWVFGGISVLDSTPARQIWRGRLNRLIP